MRLATFVFALMVAMPANAANAAGGPESVEFAQGDVTLKAALYRPEGTGPFPAVVALHGCGGLNDRAGALGPRYRDWAQHLAKAGFAVLYPDSYGSRGLGAQCSVRNGAVRPDHERVADADAARRWLQSQPWVKPDHVSLLGWSTGAVTTLWAVRPRKAAKDSEAKTAVQQEEQMKKRIKLEETIAEIIDLKKKKGTEATRIEEARYTPASTTEP